MADRARKLTRVSHSDHADIIIRGGADDISLHNCARGKTHSEFTGPRDNVIIGHDIAGLVPHESSPGLHGRAVGIVTQDIFAASTTIPIVFFAGGDPVAMGLVASLNRPGGNVTGSAVLEGELEPKRLQLLHELIPHAAAFGVLADPAASPTESTITDLQAAARTLGLQLIVANARTERDLETAFASFSQQRVGGVLVGMSTLYNRRHERLAALATRNGLPSIFPYREYAVAGGLISYGSSLGYAYRRVGFYTGRILKGEKPADLPVEQVTKSSWSSTSRPPRRSASPSRKRCRAPPTR